MAIIFFSYRQMEHAYPEQMPATLIEALARYEIYELPIEKFRRLLLRRWRSFAEQAAQKNQIFMFECCFLQNPLTMCLGRNAESAENAKTFVLEIAESLQILEPCMIYLHPGEVKLTLQRVAQIRPPEWLDFVIADHTEQGTGKAQGWQGCEGLVKFYEMRQRIELELLAQLPFSALTIQHTDWAQNYARIDEFLCITTSKIHHFGSGL